MSLCISEEEVESHDRERQDCKFKIIVILGLLDDRQINERHTENFSKHKESFS